MSEDTDAAKERLLMVLKEPVAAEVVLEAIEVLIDSKIADFAELMAERSEALLGDRL